MAKTPKTIGSLNPFVCEHKSSNSRYSICAKTLLLSQRIAGQQKTGHGLRNLVGLAMQGYKRIFGNTMKAQWLPPQKTEAWACAFAVN